MYIGLKIKKVSVTNANGRPVMGGLFVLFL